MHRPRLPGRSSSGGAPPPSEATFAPMAVAEVELSGPLAGVPEHDADGRRHSAARVLVRLHTKVLGLVVLPMVDGGLTPAACAAGAWAALGPRINAHLEADGLPAVTELGPDGVGTAASPACLRDREALLADAPLVSVLICTRDRPELVARTVRSVEALAYPAIELIVADGSKGPETAALFRDVPHVRYLHVGDNGICVASNRGLAAATGEVVAFTDDDVVVDPHWVTELALALAARPSAVCVTGAVVALEVATPAQLWFEESGAFTEGFDPRVIGLGLPQEAGSLLPYATGRIGAGANMAWRRAALLALGGFDVAMDALTPPWPLRAAHRSAAEDLAAYFDALVAGHEIVFTPDALVRHEHRRTEEELLRQLYWHGLGLGAYLMRCVVTQPRSLPAFLRRVPRGLAYGFAPDSTRNEEKSATFPAALTRAEHRGVLHGPFAYLRGLPRARRIRAAERGAPA